ncbi:nuclear distribution protein PAC1 [Nadsonia fulvescens var. elongata DSM 6958]|uniref:Nuclear distribution protein PAC1 n=1 Tax=Nadsonia fulvescens var. elongata DSM 6958 TaxID=857566 RepID=A0A1E3PL35_9ASCO|nr:nuclear distribution protein PAC1 [Nadsonia fulvescens var. elongata DSM 6958]
MGSILTDRQKAELNKTVLAYLVHQCPGVPAPLVGLLKESLLPPTIASLTSELDFSNGEEIRKYSQVLEKKWFSVIRLQRQIMDTESKLEASKQEIEAITSTAGFVLAGGLSKFNDPINWLPKLPSKYSLSGHRQPITAVTFHPVFTTLASSSEDGTIKLWDYELGQPETTIKAHTKSVVDIDFGGPKNAPLLASCSADLTIKIWDPNQEYDNIKTLTGHDHTISAIRFLPSGTHLVSASRDRTIRVWDINTGYCVKTLSAGHTDWIKSVEVTPDSQYIISAGIDRTARITNLSTYKSDLVLIGHEHVIEHAIFAPASANIYLAGLENLPKPISSNYTPSFEYLATCSRDKTIKLWNTRGVNILTLTGHDNWVRALSFHPSGRYLISVSDDKSIRCWDLKELGKCVKKLENAHNHFISCLKWAPPRRSLNEAVTTPVSNLNINGPDSAEVSAKRLKAESNDSLKNARCVIVTGSVDLDVKIWM